MNFDCNQHAHASALYLLLLGLPQYLSPNNILLLNLEILILGNLSIFAFSKIADFAYRGKASFVTNLLATLLYATHPIVIGNAVNPVLDTGVIIFFLLFFCALLYKKTVWSFVLGLILVFTKESGVLLYGLSIALYCIVFIVRNDSPTKERWKALLYKTPFLIPLVLYICYTLTTGHFFHGPEYGVPDVNFASIFLKLDLTDRRYLFGLADVFILNFSWVSSLLILLFFLWRGALFVIGKVPDNPEGLDRRTAQLIVLIWLFTLFILPKYLPYNHSRYLSSICLLSLFVTVICLIHICRNIRLRIAFLSGVLVLQFLSIFRTIDPLSLKIFGSFPFGTHRLLTLGLAAHDPCCGYGADQLVYNLEYTEMDTLQTLVYQWMQPSENTTIVLSGTWVLGLDQPLVPGSFQRTLNSTGFSPQYMHADEVLKKKPMPEKLYFIRYPNYDDRADMQKLLTRYKLVEERKFDHNGYSLMVAVMAPKQ